MDPDASPDAVTPSRHHGGDRSGQTTGQFDPDLVELVFILTDSRERYLIPAGVIEARSGIVLGDKWRPFRV